MNVLNKLDKMVITKGTGLQAWLFVETTGLRGGDSGHGGYTKVRIRSEDSDSESPNFPIIEFTVRGDWETKTLRKCLRDVVDFLDVVLEEVP